MNQTQLHSTWSLRRKLPLNPVTDSFFLTSLVSFNAGPGGRAVWGVDTDRSDAELVGSNPA
jgi:hypothetical protein